jgi:hypothetical protein
MSTLCCLLSFPAAQLAMSRAMGITALVIAIRARRRSLTCRADMDALILRIERQTEDDATRKGPRA